MARKIRLRKWQKAALDQLHATWPRDYVVCATPGAGKTVFAITVVLHDLQRHPHRRVVVVAPTRQLKDQWAREAAEFGLQLEPNWAGTDIPADAHGIVTTYAQVASNPAAVAAVADDAVVICDEVHHAGDDKTWGGALEVALGTAGFRLLLSGTPWRSDNAKIPFVAYDDDGVAQADYVYGYADALRDGGVVRPVYFPRIGGDMEWEVDGYAQTAAFTDTLDRQGESRRLRTALAPHGGWLRDVIRQAWERLEHVRQRDPDAAMIVFTMNQDHARAVAAVVADVTGHTPVVAVSEDPGAQEAIEAFKTSSAPVLVSVRMTSEGYDAKRLRVGVYATNVVQSLFWTQALGRILRWRADAGPRQAAWMFIPDDPRLRELAFGITEQRMHVLTAKTKKEQDDDALDPLQPPPATGEQVSLFSAISSTAAVPADGIVADDDGWDDGPDLSATDDDPGLEVVLPPPPRTAAGHATAGPTFTSRAALRRANHDRVKAIARLTGLSHEEINGRLNKAAAIRKVTGATVPELHRRLQAADTWVDAL